MLHLGQSLWLRLQFFQHILSVCLSDTEVGGRRRECGREKTLIKVSKGSEVLPFHLQNIKYCGSNSIEEVILNL